ncbi:hypothetical protein RSAG8_08730, partial [Rhizoctonia solani AG-8 WAC10335]
MWFMINSQIVGICARQPVKYGAYTFNPTNHPIWSSCVRDEQTVHKTLALAGISRRNADVNSATRTKEPVYPKQAHREASQRVKRSLETQSRFSSLSITNCAYASRLRSHPTLPPPI